MRQDGLSVLAAVKMRWHFPTKPSTTWIGQSSSAKHNTAYPVSCWRGALTAFLLGIRLMLMLTSLKASCTWEINGGAETRPIKMIKSTENDQTKRIRPPLWTLCHWQIWHSPSKLMMPIKHILIHRDTFCACSYQMLVILFRRPKPPVSSFLKIAIVRSWYLLPSHAPMLQFDLFSFCDRKDITKEGLASLFGGLHFILPTIQSVDGCGLQCF